MEALNYLSIAVSVFTAIAVLLKRLGIKGKLQKVKPKIVKAIISILLLLSLLINIFLIFFVFIEKIPDKEIFGLILLINTILLSSIALKITGFLNSYREKEEEKECLFMAERHFILLTVLCIIICFI